jgi:hypothetical protein
MSWTLTYQGPAGAATAEELGRRLTGIDRDDEATRSLREQLISVALNAAKACDPAATVWINLTGEGMTRLTDQAKAHSLSLQVHSHLAFIPQPAQSPTNLTPEGIEIKQE